MNEKVLHEVRFVETDDGYRIDIKGDKEQLRKMGMQKMFRQGFSPWAFARYHRFRHIPWGHLRGFWCPPAWDTEDESADDSQTD